MILTNAATQETRTAPQMQFAITQVSSKTEALLTNYNRTFSEAGSWSCECQNGFIKHDDTCEDKDECEAGANLKKTAKKPSDVCETGFTCENTRGSYICKDKDECADDKDPCDHPLFSCINSEGSYECQCIPGFGSDFSETGYIRLITSRLLSV